MKRATIRFQLNGEPWSFEVDSSDTLLEALRDQAGIKSPKIACDRGDCGACTVKLDGKTVRSCLVLAIEIDGAEVRTVEGLVGDQPSPLQQAFVERNAFQCGFCAPGMVLAADELLEANPHPDREEVQEALSGNLCRCTGYEKIIDTVVEFGRRNRQGGER